MASVSAKVQKAIDSDLVVIFSKTNCPFCVRVKELFDRKDQEYTAIELDKRSDGSQIQDVLQDLTGARTVPRVFINGEFCGGCDDILKLERTGELDRLLGQR